MLGELKRKQIGEGAFMNSVIEPKFKSDRISLCLVTPLEKEKATITNVNVAQDKLVNAIENLGFKVKEIKK